MYSYHDWYYHDSFGVAHWFPSVGTTVIQPTGQYCSSTFTSSSGIAGDGSGWTLSATGGSVNSVTSAQGAVLHPPLNTSGGTGTFTDRNGNQLTVNSSAQFFDTLSATSPVLTVTGTGTPSSPRAFAYTAPSGASAPYTMKYTTYTIRTAFGCNGITEYGANGTTTANLVSEIDLPDFSVSPNSKYTFTYETTPGDTHTPHHVTGRLASVTLPTGGTISYSYTGGSSGNITCADGSASGLKRYTPDTGSSYWQYDRAAGTGAAYTTTITDPSPQSNKTVVQFQGISQFLAIYETQRDFYQGAISSANLLKTVKTCYNGNTANCTSTAIATPISQRNIITVLPGGLQSEHDDLWNAYGAPTESDDYDYGTTSHGALLKKTIASYSTMGNINAFRQTVNVQDAANHVVSTINYNYDETSVVATTGTPQHTNPTTVRGNLTSTKTWVNGTSYLMKYATYYDTGTLKTSTDVNSGVTTYNYASGLPSCNNSFATSTTKAISPLSTSQTWNCTGGVQLTATDENGQATTTAYTDLYFWRPASATDPTGAVTSTCYGLVSGGSCTTSPNQRESTLTFNSGNSTVDMLTTLDGLGRAHVQQTRQGPSLTTFDSVETDYDSIGRVSRVTLPYSGSAGQTNSTIAGTTTTYDALSRPLTVLDGGGGSTIYNHGTPGSQKNDVLITQSPAPTGENSKRRQLVSDPLGRLTSVCEVTAGTTAWPGGTCAPNTSQTQTGYWTQYTYNPMGNLMSVLQNAQAAASLQQTRTYTYDWMNRMTSEGNPESGTTTYVYDFTGSSFCGGYTSNGDLVRKVDAIGTSTCNFYDSLHRLTDVGTTRGSVDSCKRFRYDNTTGVLGSRPTGVSVSNVLGRLVEAETDTCAWPITQSTIIADEWFSYTARGEASDLYESTPHSGGYYHTAATYWANGAVNQLTAPGGYAAAYNLDGKGRVYSTAPSVGALSATVYNAASLPTQITFASSDSDNFTYDANTNRMTQYKFNINGQSVIGNLTWNPVGTLASLGITDPFNSANAQTCSYSHDDLVRIASVNCGASKWQQNFTYDAFGNITKTVPTGGTGYSFQPTYSTATNRMTLIGGSTPSYDANGNVLNDFLHSYAWNADGRPITIDGVSVTYDALGRMVERNNGGAYSEIAYAPTGEKIEIMSGQSYTKAFVPLPGGAVAVYGGGIVYYRHPDYLRSSRFASTGSRTMYFDGAYAPFGEPYAQTGSTDLSFTGMNQDTVSNLYDFLAREYGIQGRWPSPDPAGTSATCTKDPQSQNRYAYVRNKPLTRIDPTGMLDCDPDDPFCGDPCIFNPFFCFPPLPPVGGGGFSGGGGEGPKPRPFPWPVLFGFFNALDGSKPKCKQTIRDTPGAFGVWCGDNETFVQEFSCEGDYTCCIELRRAYVNSCYDRNTEASKKAGVYYSPTAVEAQFLTDCCKGKNLKK